MKETYKKFTIELIQDENSESPREWDNLGTMYCFHRRYSLGDKHDLDTDEVKEIFNDDKNYVSLPLYLYDHGGITMSTSSFSCRWDSGQVGIIAVSREKIFKEYGKKYLTKKLRDQIISYLVGEVKTYDQYLTGDVYGYQITDSEDNVRDSCWGFYGTENALDQARSQIDYYVKTEPLQLDLPLEDLAA